MPFCPKCKYEYKEGIKICADCNVELVDSLADVSVTILTREEDTIDEALEFLIANNFNGAYKEESDTFDNLFDLKVPESKRKEASDMLNVYYREVHEASEEEKELEEEIKINRDNSSRYVNLDDKAENYRSGAIVLIGMGIAGAVFLILVNIGVFNLPVPSSTKTLINIVMGGLFAAFIILGINSVICYRKIKVQAIDADDLEKKIIDWADNILDKDSITVDDRDGDSEEIMFFNRTEALKKQLDEAFPDLDQSFKDHIVEELYDRIFECE